MKISTLPRAVAAVAFGLIAASCGGSSSSGPSPTPAPTAPSVPAITLTGTYAGNAIDSSGPGTMTWRITQTGTAISGIADAGTPLDGNAFHGSVTGTLTGSSLTFTLTVPAGGVNGQPTCTVSITGTGTAASSSSITGTYSGTSTCAAAFTAGQFALSKQ
jgi:hypothetical protein